MTLKPTRDKIYENCLVRNINGNAMFRCDLRKMKWYLSRNLAEKIQDDPPQIRLLFEADGPGHENDPFFLSDRINQCVVCGTGESLTRHHILPHCYRRFFPRDLDRFGSYDVMPLCVDHHHDYEESAWDLRRALAEEYGAPIAGISARTCRDTNRAIRFALAIVKHGHKIPTKRKERMYEDIRQIFGDVSDREALAKIVAAKSNEATKTHSELIVSTLKTYEAIGSFVIRWRKHFVETMSPKFMPANWDVNRVFVPS